MREDSVADEILQDCFIKYWQWAPKFDPNRGSALAWLVTIARNHSISYMRKKRESYEGLDPIDATDAFSSAGSKSIPSEDRQVLKNCLEAMDEAKREMIVLAYCWGYSRDALAEQMKKPVNTIKTWLRRGLLDLRSCMRGGGV